jgi:hypothetical protein
MVDEHDVRRIALALPGTVEENENFAFHVGKTGFAWPYPERVHPKKARVPRLDIFVLRVADLSDKEALLAGEPDTFFTTDHYNGYPAVMVRLAAIDLAALTELLTEAHAAAIEKEARGGRRPRRSRSDA